ncbi:glutathione-regulated potassium-efflux system ancillary protein KefG [Parasalinivibrio latis]|uniref:glutathione-regulated potassium-efflux system ancillary protein KefG n=1 Tax=Parasalinivibrio latis TaxID=2952610 RepID=UPI0030E2D260
MTDTPEDKPRILVIYAHPDPHGSHANRKMVNAASLLSHVTVTDLYGSYPDFIIDVSAEREKLLSHDIYVFQFPLQMYSCPALLKEWIDVVLAKGFAHGDGSALAGKYWRCAVTTGGAADAFSESGYNKYTMAELLQPFELTALLCRGNWLSPLVLHWARRVSDDDRNAHAEIYADWLESPLPLIEGHRWSQ